MLRLFCLVLLGTLGLPGRAMATDYAVQKQASTLGFTGTFQGAPFHGTFSRWDANIRYDPADLGHSRLDVTVDMTSASTGEPDRDDALPGADFFNAMAYPKAHYLSTGFRRESGGQVVANGNLTLRGVTRPISLTIDFAPQDNGATLDASGTIDRLAFGVGGGEYADTSVIGGAVNIHAHLVLTPR